MAQAEISRQGVLRHCLDPQISSICLYGDPQPQLYNWLDHDAVNDNTNDDDDAVI